MIQWLRAETTRAEATRINLRQHRQPVNLHLSLHINHITYIFDVDLFN